MLRKKINWSTETGVGVGEGRAQEEGRGRGRGRGREGHIRSETWYKDWCGNILGYLSADIICSEKRTGYRESSSRKTVIFEEQIMPRTNIRAYFRTKWRLLCLFSFKYFSQRVLFWKLGNITRIFSHVTRLDQTRASENIWWIIKDIKTVDTASDWLIGTLGNIIPHLTPSDVILVLLRSNVWSFGIPKLRNSSTCSSSISLFKERSKTSKLWCH